MSHRVAKVRRDAVEPCFTCPLCHKLLRDATTIIECLHTFCKSCIYKKLSDEEMERCPVCSVDLGCVPLDKLKSDHNLQAIRAKIFPYGRKKEKSAKFVAPVQLPAKQKERSLSSLVVSTTSVPTQSERNRRISRSMARKASTNSSLTIGEPVQKEDDSIEKHTQRARSQERLNKYTRNMRKNLDSDEPSNHQNPFRGRESRSGSRQSEVDLWKPLNWLAEAAVSSRSAELGTEGSLAKSEMLHTHDSEGLLNKTETKEHRKKPQVEDVKNNSDLSPSESERPRNLRRGRPKRATNLGESEIPPRVMVDATSAKLDQRNYPIWLSLVALDKEGGDYPQLTQIPAHYIRIKDGKILVSFILKYLKAKLCLKSEEVVEIKCMGQRVIPTLTFYNLVDVWLQTIVRDRVSVTIGSSAKEFVMMRVYILKGYNIIRSRNKFDDALTVDESVLEKDFENIEAHIGKGIWGSLLR